MYFNPKHEGETQWKIVKILQIVLISREFYPTSLPCSTEHECNESCVPNPFQLLLNPCSSTLTTNIFPGPLI